jgi:uncharacterized membrane protein
MALRWLLPVSLTLNAFLLAAAIGLLLFGPPPPPPPDRIFSAMAHGMTTADAAVMRNAFAAHAQEMQAGYASMRGFHDRIGAVLLAPTFDKRAMQEVFDSSRKSREAMDNAISNALVEAATGLSTDGRHKLAARHPPWL